MGPRVNSVEYPAMLVCVGSYRCDLGAYAEHKPSTFRHNALDRSESVRAIPNVYFSVVAVGS